MNADLLEFASYKECLKKLLASNMGESALASLAPLDDWGAVRGRWADLREMMDLISTDAPLHFGSLADIHEALAIKQGATLEGPDLIDIANVLKSMARIPAYLSSARRLAELAAEIDPLMDLSSTIQYRLEPTGEISERGNPVLADLRRRYRSLRGRILNRMEDILDGAEHAVQEDLITTRNDRYVIPLKQGFGSKVKGIAHDYSRTQQTVYVEPLELVDDNNELSQVRSSIREEEHKVLSELSRLVYDRAAVIRRNLEIYGQLDLLHAAARWAVRNGAIIPQVSETCFELKSARHPILIEQLGFDNTVPLDIRLPDEKSCLIISGPNAGGKTVALKTLGLLHHMARCGLAIPAADGSRVMAVGSVHVAMDSSQDIQHGLSSFTAHAYALKEIYNKVAPGDLVLLDEPGEGTDYQQGGAFAVAYVDAVLKKGAHVVLTSHSQMVKLYGLASDLAENAAAAFDDSGLMPLYRLEYGLMGGSHAFEILRSVDFPAEIIDEARAVIAEDEQSPLARALDDIESARKMKLAAEAERAELERLKVKLQQETQQFEKERLESAYKYKDLIKKAERLARRPHAPEKVAELKKSARELEDAAARAPEALLDIKVGSIVRLRGAKAEAEVLKLSDGKALILSGGKRLTMGLDMLEVVPQAKKKQKQRTAHVKAGAPMVHPIVVVGMRVDEALPVVEQALDRAMLAGQKEFEVIHGGGTGALRKAIREHIKHIPGVAGFEDGAVTEGGSTKTVVRLKNG